MKITIQQKKNNDSAKQIVEISFVEKETKFIEGKDGNFHIEIKIPKAKQITERKILLIARKVIQTAKQHKIEQIIFDFGIFKKLSSKNDRELASLIAQNFEMANYEFREFKTKPKEGWKDVRAVIIYNASSDVFDGIKKGQKIGQMVNECRLISNTPGGDMTPQILAKHAKRLIEGIKVKIQVLGQKEMEKLKMGAILGVAKGSPEEPKFIIME